MPEVSAAVSPDGAVRAAAAELAAVREGLERATKTFTERLERGGAELERARRGARESIASSTPARPLRPPAPFAGAGSQARAPTPAQARAEAEARAYVEEAKRRAERLLATMTAAAERETAEIRAAAERDAEASRRRAEADAGAVVEEARRVAERIVAERQRRIGALSDGVVGRAEALTAGLEDAAAVRAQFDAFARALAGAAERIARGAGGPATVAPATAERAL